MSDDNVWPGKRIDLSGQRFGALTVLEYAGFERKRTKWLCQCDCGERVVSNTMKLRSGLKTFCNVNGHGWGDGPRRERLLEYASWQAMKNRCLNQNDPGYKHYGGRGIRICSEWVDNFERFLSDMGPRPTPKHSLDRYPNNDGNYEPGNCRWATPSEQARNKRGTVYVQYEGKKIGLADLTESLGLSRSLVLKRMNAGWSLEAALTTPSNRQNRVDKDDDWGPEVKFT